MLACSGFAPILPKANRQWPPGNGTAKLADVGLAKVFSHTKTVSQREDTGALGTWNWAAPEALLGQRVDEQADIYRWGHPSMQSRPHAGPAQEPKAAALELRGCASHWEGGKEHCRHCTCACLCCGVALGLVAATKA